MKVVLMNKARLSLNLGYEFTHESTRTKGLWTVFQECEK